MSLAYINAKYPGATTATGLIGSVVSWIMQFFEPLTQFFSLIGAAAGAALAVISLCAKIQSWSHRRLTRTCLRKNPDARPAGMAPMNHLFDAPSHRMKTAGNTIEPILAMLAMFAASAAAAVQSRWDPDLVAVIGAGAAAVITVFEAQDKGRSRLQKGSVFIASLVVGATGPGGFVWTFLPARMDTIIWQIWAGMGFGFGLLGWAITHKVMNSSIADFFSGLISIFTKKP